MSEIGINYNAMTRDELVWLCKKRGKMLEHFANRFQRQAELLSKNAEKQKKVNELQAEIDRLWKLVNRDCIQPCACCGKKLSWQFAGDGTNAVEVETGEFHKKCFTMEDAPPGTYRYLEREVERLKRGDFTPEEFQNLCHHRNERLGCTREEFVQGCLQYQQKLFGDNR